MAATRYDVDNTGAPSHSLKAVRQVLYLFHMVLTKAEAQGQLAKPPHPLRVQ